MAEAKERNPFEIETPKPSKEDLRRAVEARKQLLSKKAEIALLLTKWQNYESGDWAKVNEDFIAIGMKPIDVQRAVDAGLDGKIGPGTLAKIAAMLNTGYTKSEGAAPELHVEIGQAQIEDDEASAKLKETGELILAAWAEIARYKKAVAVNKQKYEDSGLTVFQENQKTAEANLARAEAYLHGLEGQSETYANQAEMVSSGGRKSFLYKKRAELSEAERDIQNLRIRLNGQRADLRQAQAEVNAYNGQAREDAERVLAEKQTQVKATEQELSAKQKIADKAKAAIEQFETQAQV